MSVSAVPVAITITITSTSAGSQQLGHKFR